MDSMGATFHSVGDSDADGQVVYDYMGAYTEAPAAWIVPVDTALAAALEYQRTGVPGVEEPLAELRAAQIVHTAG